MKDDIRKPNVILYGKKYMYHVTRNGDIYDVRNGKEVKKELHNHEYSVVTLYGKNYVRGIKIAVHRLVAETYNHNNPNNYMEIRHKNGNTVDNRASNLEYVKTKHYSKPVMYEGKKSVLCVETGTIYPSLWEVEIQLGLYENKIRKCCDGKLETCGGCHWQYI